MGSQPVELLNKIDGKMTNDKKKPENSVQDRKADFDLKRQKQADDLVVAKISKDQLPKVFIAASYIPKLAQQGYFIIDPKINAETLQTFLNHIARGRQVEAMLKDNNGLALTDHAKRTFKSIIGSQYAV